MLTMVLSKESFVRKRELSDNILHILIKSVLNRLDIKYSPLTCYEGGHTWTPYCRQAFLDVLTSSFKYSLKLYSTFYVISALLRGKPLGYYRDYIWKEIIRSTIFLTSNAGGFMMAFCLWRKVMGFYFYYSVLACAIPLNCLLIQTEPSHSSLCKEFNLLSVWLPCVVVNSVVLGFIERQSRHGMLALYMTNLACEVGYRMLQQRGYAPSVPGGDVIIFSFGLAGFLHLYRQEKLQGFLSKLISEIFGCDIAPTSDRSHLDDTHRKLTRHLPQAIQNLIAPLSSRRLATLRHHNCQHAHGCLTSLFKKFTTRFGAGYVLSLLIRSPSHLMGAVRGKPALLSRWLFSRENINLGLFLGSLTGIQQLSSCVLRWMFGFSDTSRYEGIITGSLSGLSLLFFRSPVLALYVLLKFIDVKGNELVEKRKLPRIKHFYVYLYAVATAVLFHAGVWEPHAIRPAYWNFMLKITGGRFASMNRQLLEKIFGCKSATLYPHFWPTYDPRFSDITPDILKTL